MKKRIVTCLMVALFIVLTASLAYAYTYNRSTDTYFDTPSLYISSNMHGQDDNDQSYITGGTHWRHQSYLIDSGGNACSSTSLFVGYGETKNLYPSAFGNLNMRIVNYDYFGQTTLTVRGEYRNLYN